MEDHAHPMKTKPKILYWYRGMVERGANYRWVEGWSRGGKVAPVQYPWLTRREAQREAAAEGCVAVFMKG